MGLFLQLYVGLGLSLLGLGQKVLYDKSFHYYGKIIE